MAAPSLAAWIRLVLAGTALLSMGTTSAIAQTTVDISGVWKIRGIVTQLTTDAGAPPPLKREAAKVYAANTAKLKAGNLSFDPAARCVSPGLPRILAMPFPFQIVQRPDKMVYLFEWNYWNRRVDMTGKRQDVPYPLALGVSGGRIEGDAIVVTTKGLRADSTWLDAAGLPHSEDLIVEERMTLVDGGRTLEDRVTMTDPQTFTRPWTTVLRFDRQPEGTRIAEDVCLDRIGTR